MVITVIAAFVIIVALMFPVLRIYGNAMAPLLSEGDIVVSFRTSNIKTGDIIAFYYNDKILVKRVIAFEGDTVDIDDDGTVYVNNVKIDEPYVSDKALGQCDIEMPYQVPEARIFVMGDNRTVSVDSRSTAIGSVAEEQIVGKVVLRVWPLNRFGRLDQAG